MSVDRARNILVTGAAGFIGSHVVEALIEHGHRVTALVHYNAQRHLGNLAGLDPEHVPLLRFEFGDVGDPEQMNALVAGHDIVIHAAALIGIPYSYAAPRSTLRTNTEATLNLLEAARRHGIGRFVFVSTSEVYGSALYVPIDERHPLQSQSPYAASKIAAEAMVEAWRRNFGVSAVIIRPFNTYGPRQSQRAIIPTIIEQALAGGPLRLGALWPVRDFTFVTDTAAGLIAAALTPGLAPGPYNLGTGEGVAVGEIVALVSEIIERPLVVEQDDRRMRPPEGEVERLISDNSAFRAAGGWKPLVSLDEGLRRTIDVWRGVLRKTGGGPPAAYVV